MTTRTRKLLILAVLAFFSAIGVIRHLHMYGEDLASSYVGCQLLAAHQDAHLYSHSPTVFSHTDDPVWDEVALHNGYTALNLLHPYVQTPLWAWALQPACTRVNFRIFCDGFIVLIMLCTSALIWLVARYWTPSLFQPGWIFLIFAVFYRTEPFKYAIFLAQTHIIFVLLSVAALILAERARPGWAGFLLAAAALVKVTPGLLCLYWLLTRRWKAAVSFVVSLLALTALTVVVVGPALTLAYVHSLAENGNVLLVSFNNQSFAGWIMGHKFPIGETTRWIIYRLPRSVKFASLLFSVVGVAAGAWLDNKAQELASGGSQPPYGAVLALMAATMFAPIAWTHYYILLIVPGMMLVQAYREDRRSLWLGLLAIILLLNIYPFSYGAVHLASRRFSMVRSQFYSGVVTLVALTLLSLWQTRQAKSPYQAEAPF